MSRLRFRAGSWFAESPPGVGRLDPDLIFLLRGVQEPALGAVESLGEGCPARTLVGLLLLPASYLAPEPNLGRAQGPDSLVQLPRLRPGPCHSWEEVRGIRSLGVHQGQTSRSVRIP